MKTIAALLSLLLALGAPGALAAELFSFSTIEKHADGTATVKWTYPDKEIEIEAIAVDVFEITDSEDFHGAFTIDKGAHTWNSTPRRSIWPGGPGFFDIKNPAQWGDAEVLTPGTTYRLDFHVQFHRLDDKKSTALPTRSVALPAVAGEVAPKRLDVLGDYGFASFVSLVLGLLFVATPLVTLAVLTACVAPAIFSSIRGDTSFAAVCRQYAQRNGLFAFFLLYAFCAITLFVVLVRIPVLLSVPIQEDENKLLQAVMRRLSMTRLRDWHVDRFDVLKLIPPSPSAP